MRGDFLSKFPDPTTSELYAGYEIAHELVAAEAADLIDDVFDVIIGDEEGSRMAQVEIAALGVPARYFHSPKACGSILRRAEARGKKIPQALKAALQNQAGDKRA